MTLFPARNYSNCTFPRLTLHACALTHTISLSYHVISLSYHVISLSFHLVTEVFQLFTHYFTFPVRFQLNSDFSYTFHFLMENLRAVLLLSLLLLLLLLIENFSLFNSQYYFNYNLTRHFEFLLKSSSGVN